MPDSQPWSQGEIIRHIAAFGKTLERIETKIEDRPSWEDITRITTAQLRTDTKQDDALKKLEDRAMQLLVLVIGAGLTGGTGLIVSLITQN